jgi:hypothetical protein
LYELKIDEQSEEIRVLRSFLMDATGYIYDQAPYVLPEWWDAAATALERTIGYGVPQ